MTDVGKERGGRDDACEFRRATSRNGRCWLQPDEVVDKILRHTKQLGGVSRISFQMNVASCPSEDDALD